MLLLKIFQKFIFLGQVVQIFNQKQYNQNKKEGGAIFRGFSRSKISDITNNSVF